MPSQPLNIRNANSQVGFRKADDELRVVWAEVIVPDVPDVEGDVHSREEIRKAQMAFMRKGTMGNIDWQHNRTPDGSFIVESFLARENDPDFIAGSWVIGVHVPDAAKWAMVKGGEFNAFSYDGYGTRVPTTIEMEIPEQISGLTGEARGHKHRFFAKFDASGRFLGGQTDDVGGHSHVIARGTLTEPAGDGHAHTFAVVDGLIKRVAA